MIITMEANKFTRATCSPKKLRLILLLYSCDDTNNRNAAKWFFENIFGKYIFQTMFLCCANCECDEYKYYDIIYGRTSKACQ